MSSYNFFLQLLVKAKQTKIPAGKFKDKKKKESIINIWGQLPFFCYTIFGQFKQLQLFIRKTKRTFLYCNGIKLQVYIDYKLYEMKKSNKTIQDTKRTTESHVTLKVSKKNKAYFFYCNGIKLQVYID